MNHLLFIQRGSMRNPLIAAAALFVCAGLVQAETLPDPDGKSQNHGGVAIIEVPLSATAKLTASTADAYWEQAAIVYRMSSSATPIEVIRFGSLAHHNRNTDKVLSSGRYGVSCWHKEGAADASLGWVPSRSRVAESGSDLIVSCDDSKPGTTGDADFNDTVITVRLTP